MRGGKKPKLSSSTNSHSFQIFFSSTSLRFIFFQVTQHPRRRKDLWSVKQLIALYTLQQAASNSEFQPSTRRFGLVLMCPKSTVMNLKRKRQRDKDPRVFCKQMKMIQLGWKTLPAEQTSEMFAGKSERKLDVLTSANKSWHREAVMENKV